MRFGLAAAPHQLGPEQAGSGDALQPKTSIAKASRIQNRIAPLILESRSHGGALNANLDATANTNLHFAQKALSKL
jgi:inosine-uridine nucleoside N-ribohydrolase